MSRYNTNDPVPSSDMRNVWDNAQALDEAINSQQQSYTDRLGAERRTWAGIEADSEAKVAEIDSIITSLDTASFTFESAPAGLAGTTNGQYFRVPQNDVFFYFRNANGSAALVATMAGQSAYNEIARALASISGFIYNGDGDVIPLITDASNKTILGYDKNADSLVGIFSETIDKVRRGESLNTARHGIYGLFIDANNKVVLGYDANKDTLIGSFFGDESRVSGGEVAQVNKDGVFAHWIDSNNRVLLGYDPATDSIIGPGIGGVSGGGAQYPAWENEKFPHTMTKKAINQCFYYGQSNAIGTQGSPALTTSRPFSNLMFASGILGTTYTALVRSVEASLETGAATMCNYLNLAAYRENGISVSSFTSLVSAPGQGGARISWLNKGSTRYNNFLLPQMSAGYALNNDLQIDTVAWIQGEADSGDGTYHIETVQGYKQLLLGLVNNVNNDAKAATGQGTPVIFLTYQHSTYVVEGNTHEAFLLAEEEDSRVYVIVPTYVFPHAPDNLHLNNIGFKWMGAYFGRARKQIMIDGIKPKRIRPVSATYSGNKIRVRFKVPVAPIIFDTAILKPTTNYGFSVRIDGVLTAISSLEIVNGDTVVISMPASLNGGSVEVRYAYDYNGTTLKLGGSGNLVDSCKDKIEISGVEYLMPYVTPHFKITAVNGVI